MSDLIRRVKLRRVFGALFTFLVLVTPGPCGSTRNSSQSPLGIPELTGPSEALRGHIVTFECVTPRHPKNESVLLQLFRTGDRVKPLGESTSLSGEGGVFIMVIRLSHEGGLECVAKAQNNTRVQPTVSRTHHLRVLEPLKGAHIIVSSGAADLIAGDSLELLCRITSGNHVTYHWALDHQLISDSPARLLSGNRLLVNRTSSEDSGLYQCLTSNYFNQTLLSVSHSAPVEITVKEVVSAPDISFTVLKEGSHVYAVVTCQSTQGSPPVTYSLYNGTELVDSVTSANTSAVFKLPLVLDQDLGKIRCEADNGAGVVPSLWLPLEVVSVGGPVTLRYDHDIGENFAVVGLRLYCRVAKGSHPHFQWFLNKTLLHDRGSFYYVVNQLPEQSILLLSVGRSSAGMYHCKVSDSFDDSTAIRSRGQYLTQEVVNHLPLLVVAVVFVCFTALILLVCICCGVGVVYRHRANGEKPLLELEMEMVGDADETYEDELDLREYGEDAGVVTAARGGEFDQPSEASADEWPQIAEWKKTLEDEEFELL